jgi:hypothetical protein|uniref:Uncharacterized protein n=1 Tax=viral metagenome TaxID=1070528 RepID=A0A6C0IW02_9ZZZZ
MTIHTCSRCGYTTNRKQNLKLHLLKRKTCPPKINETSIYDILIFNGFEEEAINYKNTNDCKSNVVHVIPNVISNVVQTVIHVIPKEIKCKHCNKKFATRHSKSKHIKYNCKVLKLTEETISLNDETKLKNYDALVIQVEQLVNKMELLETSKPTKISNKNIINNGTVNNIILNNYGSEDFMYLTKKVFMKLLETPLTAIPKLIGIKYFNTNHPENQNIKITNIHDKFAKIYKDNKWLVSNKKDIIQELVDNGYADFEEFKDLNEEELTDKIKYSYKKMEKYYIKNLDELYKQSEMGVINGTNQLD